MSNDATATQTNQAPPRKKSRARRILTWVGIALGVIVLALAAAYWYFLYAPLPEEPQLDAEVSEQTIEVSGMERPYIAVVPHDLPDDAPLWIALHGSNMDGDGMRTATGYQLDELAVREGFVTLYPTGYEMTWNGCRTQTSYAAAEEDIDDVAFLEALVAQAAADYGIDTEQVYGLGYSNGSNMLFRMAAESAGTFAGIQANAANYPTADNYGCEPLSAATPTILVEGTDDPINPYDGGDAGWGGSLGPVMSAQESAAYIADVNGVVGEPGETLIAGTQGEAGAVTATTYGAGADAPVVLLTVEGGGHVVPNPATQSPRIMGSNPDTLNAPEVAWELFNARP